MLVHKEILTQHIKISPKSDYDSTEHSKLVRSLYSPKRMLLSILKDDKEIREWFLSTMGVIIRYQNETSESMSSIYDKVA